MSFVETETWERIEMNSLKEELKACLIASLFMDADMEHVMNCKRFFYIGAISTYATLLNAQPMNNLEKMAIINELKYELDEFHRSLKEKES